MMTLMIIAATIPLVFNPAKAVHYMDKTQMVTDDSRDGFKIVLKGDTECDTAWRIESDKVNVSNDCEVMALEFEIFSACDFLKFIPPTKSWVHRVNWYDAKGETVKTRPWVDALGIMHDSEIFNTRFASNLWSAYRLVFEVPEKASSVAVQFGVDGPNVGKDKDVRIRNVRVTFVGKGEKRPEPSYPDFTGPMIRREFKAPIEDDTTEIRYRITDVSGVDWNSLKIERIDKTEKVEFRRDGESVVLMPDKKLEQGDYHFRFTIKDKLGNTMRIAKAFRVGHSPDVPGTKLRDDGVVLLDNTPMFPIGLYAMCPREANLYSLDRCFGDLAAAGCNLAHSYSHYRDKDFANGCKKFGMISFQAEYSAADGSPWFEKTARQDPTVGFWYIGDDTAMHFEPCEVENRADALEALDGTRLTCHADVYTTRFKEYADIVDVFMPEIYPVHTDADADLCVATTINVMENSWKDIRQQSSGKTRTIIPIIQYFKGWSGWKRVPKVDEFHAMNFAAIIHGAKGITWYTYGGFWDKKRNSFNCGVTSSKEMWDATTNATRLISSLSTVLIERDVVQPAPPQIIEGPTVDIFKRPSVSMLYKESGDYGYIFAVNAVRKPVKARIFTGIKRELKIERTLVGSESRSTINQTAEGDFVDSFAPFGVHIYRFRRIPPTSMSPLSLSWRHEVTTPEMKGDLENALRMASQGATLAESLDWLVNSRPEWWRFESGERHIAWLEH